MKTKFLLGTTILLGTSLLPLSVISCSNQVTSSEGENKPSNPGQDNTNPKPPTDNEGENKPSNPGEDNTNPKPPTDNEGENKPSNPGEGNTNPTPPTDNGGQQPSQPTIVYHEITGYDDIDAFIKNDNPVNKTEVNHIDLNRKNNVVANLEWISHTDNVKYSYKQGSHKGRQIGEKNNKAKLTEDQVIEIRQKYDSGEMTQMELAKEYNVGWSTIHNIVFRLTWKHI